MSAEFAAVLGGVFVAAFASGLAGFAFNLVGAGILLHLLPPQETAPVMVVASLLIQGATLGVVRTHMRWAAIRPFVLGGALGTPFGVLVLGRASAGAITAFIGALLVFYAGTMLARIALRRAPPVLRGGAAADTAVGFAGGVLGGLGGFSGALPVMWGDLKGLRKDQARAIFQPYIVAMQVVAAIALLAAGFFTRESVILLASIMPALFLGTWLGLRAYRAIPAEGFRVVLLGLLLASGLSLVI
jgi:uncharacterized membrane protein YfcA